MNPNQNTADFSAPQKLGPRAFSLLVSRHSKFAFVLLVIAVVAFLARNAVGGGYMDRVVLWSIILFVVFIAYAFLAGWLVYKNYTFSLEDDAFKIRRGVFSKKETAIPYRQIRDVNIERSISQQIYGVSKLVILTVGEESLSASVSEAVLPVVDNIDKNLALTFQSELLKRANVQKISQQ